MKFLLMMLAAACAFSISCERHEFEGKNGTKQLSEPHAAHKASHADHGAPIDPAKPEKSEAAPK